MNCFVEAVQRANFFMPTSFRGVEMVMLLVLLLVHGHKRAVFFRATKAVVLLNPFRLLRRDLKHTVTRGGNIERLWVGKIMIKDAVTYVHA